MTKLNVVLDSKKIEAVKKAIGGGQQKEDRKVYESFDAAVAAFQAAAKIVEDEKLGIPVMAADQSAFFEPERDEDGNVKLDEEGNPILSETLIPGLGYAVSVVGARIRNAENKMEGGIKAIVFWPMPTVEEFLESDNGADWIKKVIEKESAHVAFRGLRNAESVEEFESEFARIPTSVDDIVATHVSSGGLDTEAFDAMWAPFRDAFKQQQPKVAAHMPPKQDVIKAIRSKPFAAQEYGKLEQLGLFEFIAKKLIESAATWKDEEGNDAPIDASAIQGWLDGREALNLAPKKLDEAELDDVKLAF